MPKGADGNRIMLAQGIGLCIGIAVCLIISTYDYRELKRTGIIFYGISILLLAAVLVIGTGDKLGSRSWIRVPLIGSLEPAEIAKIPFVIMVSIFLERIKNGQWSKKDIVRLALFTGLPIALQAAEADIGNTLVFIFTFFLLLFIAEIPYKYILMILAPLVASLPLLWFFVLNNKRKERILVFLSPESDPSGAGYNVLQSKMAVGAGRMFGQGLYHGLLTQNNGVPVKESDFIFSVVGEELGFIGAVIFVALIFFILLKCVHIAKHSSDSYGSLLAVGMTSIMAFNFIENIGMAIGLMPVTGVPLPFVSQGGTALVTDFIAIGILLSVSMRRNKALKF